MSHTYSPTPYNYATCEHSDCPMAATCLHQHAWKSLIETETYLNLLNPRLCTKSADCPHYRSSTPVRFAVGFTRMQKQMYPGQYDTFSTILQAQFGRNAYFERRKGQRPLPPKEQEMIGQALVRAGVTLSLDFDAYKEDYLW